MLTKFDISDAFKNLPTKSSQWPYFCVRWNCLCYVFVRLVFGCRSSPRIFDTLSQAISWIACKNYGIQNIFHLLDDFLTVDVPDECTGMRTKAVMSLLFARLCVPLATQECVGPICCLEYLGIVLDSEKLVAKLPRDKVQRILLFLESMLHKRKCIKLELLQLLGHLNFTSRVILPGRSFVSYLIQLSTTATKLHHMVYLDSHCQEDLIMWHKFLTNWNGVSLFYDSHFTAACDMEFHTDSSLIGFGGIFQNQWFCSEWPAELPTIKEGDLDFEMNTVLVGQYCYNVHCSTWTF